MKLSSPYYGPPNPTPKPNPNPNPNSKPIAAPLQRVVALPSRMSWQCHGNTMGGGTTADTAMGVSSTVYHCGILVYLVWLFVTRHGSPHGVPCAWSAMARPWYTMGMSDKVHRCIRSCAPKVRPEGGQTFIELYFILHE